MLPEIGLFLLCLAFSLSTVGILGISTFCKIYPEKALRSIISVSWLTSSLCAVACCILVYAYGSCDFSLETVVFNCSQEQSLFYRIAAIWSNQEGSMMLWLLLLQGTLMLLLLQKTDCPKFKFWSLFIQLSLIGLFLGFILVNCHPFKRFFPIPLRGLGLNPALYDTSLGIHPPTLYSAFVGYSGLFSLTMAGALSGKLGSSIWATYIRPWALNLWGLQTAGIALGSWWAYYELGWGGWWAWDPVENVSLLPWLINLGLIHCLKPAFLPNVSGRLLLWLGTGPFLCAVFGTLLVRSGAISSVHAFVSDTNRGVLLSIMFLSLLTSVLFIFYKYINTNSSLRRWHPLWIQLVFLAGCFLSLSISFIVLLGGSMLNLPFNLNETYFSQTFMPFFLSLCIFMPWGYVASVYQKVPLILQKRLLTLACLCLTIVAFFLSSLPSFFHLSPQYSLGKALGFGTAFWVITTTIILVWDRYNSSIFRNLSKIAGLVSHAGVGLFLLGATAQTFCSFSQTVILPLGGNATVQDFKLTLKEMQYKENSLYTTEQALLDIQHKEKNFHLKVENHFFTLQQRLQHKTTIHPLGISDLYIVMGQKINNSTETYFFSVYKNTGVRLIWIGALLMALGAFIGGWMTGFMKRRKKQ